MMGRLVLFFCLIGAWFYSAAQPPFKIDDQVEERNFMPNELSFFMDPADKLSFLDISSVEYSNRFQTHGDYQNVNFQTNTAYWIRLPIHHTAKTKKTWILEFYDQTIDYIEAYIPENDGGFGLSYTSFTYGDVNLDKTEMDASGTLTASIDVTNTGSRDGVEVVQFYIRDRVGSVTRPVKELKGFEKINLKSGETKTVRFAITETVLSFYRHDLSFGAEPGDFDVHIGGDSKNVKTTSFTLK